MAEDAARTRDGISGRTPVAVRVVRALLYVLLFIRMYSGKLYPVLSFVAISVTIPAASPLSTNACMRAGIAANRSACCAISVAESRTPNAAAAASLL